MKTLAALFLIVGVSTVAGPSSVRAASRACNILWDRVAGYAPAELCTKWGGTGCATAKTDGELLCRAGGRMDECKTVKNEGQAFCWVFNASFCSQANSENEGFCHASGGSLCEQNKTADRRFWLRKLLETCGN